MSERATASEMNSYSRFKKQPKTQASTRAAMVAGHDPKKNMRNPAAIATTQGRPYNRDAAKSPTKPKRVVILRKSAAKGPSKI